MPHIQIKEMNGMYASSQVTMPDGKTKLMPDEVLEVSDEDWEILLESESGDRLQIASVLPTVPEEDLEPAKSNAQVRRKKED